MALKNVQSHQETPNNKNRKNSIIPDLKSSSSKKLVQARLPFKAITAAISTTPRVESSTKNDNDNNSDDDVIEILDDDEVKAVNNDITRKRKLSLTSDASEEEKELNQNNDNTSSTITSKRRSESKENTAAVSTLPLPTKKKKLNQEDNDVIGGDEKVNEIKTNTPKISSNTKQKSAGTPKNVNVIPIQIKLPLSDGKKNKRKIKYKSDIVDDEIKTNVVDDEKVCSGSSDDTDTVAAELNPQKRKKKSIDKNLNLVEKSSKQIEKEAKELEKKREREEKELQKKREREEKEEQRRKEREEKERKRLAEVEIKNEEKRKRAEVKEEENRKKEEERKRKEQEKEEVELKKKKAAEAFSKFFVPRTEGFTTKTVQRPIDTVTNEVKNDVHAFRPFQIKGDMKLAPILRRQFSLEAHRKFDISVRTQEDDSDCDADDDNDVKEKTSILYLDELKKGLIIPCKCNHNLPDLKEDDDDVQIIEDELERAGQKIEDNTPVEHFRAKYFKFHGNIRPPYYGTWRKKSKIITPRNPFGMDKDFFDYEIDSDLEWEEEEPGESLDGSDDEKEKESEDDDYEVDNKWFVPHGHLSDEELQNDDDDANTREVQLAKLKLLQQEFDQECKKKTEKIKPRLIGCIWVDENGNQPELCPNIIWKTLNERAILYTVPPIVEKPAAPEREEPVSPNSNSNIESKLKPISISDDMLKDLIRLMHGNRHSKQFLIKEFIAHVENNEESIKNGDYRGPLKVVVREKIDEFASWQLRSIDNENSKKKPKKQLCWIVNDETLNRNNLQNLSLKNTWEYILKPKYMEESDEKKLLQQSKFDDDAATTDIENDKDADSEDGMNKVTEVKPDNADAELRKVATEKQNQTLSMQLSQSMATPLVKKRVPLLMSVPRGQQIPTPAKNALISQFLKKKPEVRNEEKSKQSSSDGDGDGGGTIINSAIDDVSDDVVVLD